MGGASTGDPRLLPAFDIAIIQSGNVIVEVVSGSNLCQNPDQAKLRQGDTLEAFRSEAWGHSRE